MTVWCCLGLAALLGGGVFATWKVDTWRYDKQLAVKDAAHQTALTNMANANSALVLAEQGKRFALEHWLSASDQAHYRALIDEKSKQSRLRDRLATADLRLSVQIDAAASNGCCGVQATTTTGSMVHGACRTQIDRAHAQRIVGITSDGDQGLIALQACQNYIRAVER